MSRIGRAPIPIPDGVTVDITGQHVTVKGPKGELSHTVVEPILEELRLQSVSGAWDLVALATVPTIGEMDELTDRIGALQGVERTTSSLVLSTKFER